MGRSSSKARRKGYIARSAFKLLQIDDRFRILSKKDTNVAIDLGASPGGWCQILAERSAPTCQIYGVDMIELRTAIPNAHFIRGDFSTAETQSQLMAKLETSDMCPNRSGGNEDRYRIADLSLSALRCSISVLRPGGHVVLKVLGAGSSFYDEVQQLAQQWFTTVQFFKPDASRDSSDESFLVGVRKLQEKRSLGSLTPPCAMSTSRTSPRASGRSVAAGGGQHTGFGLDDWPGQQRMSTRGGRGGSHHRR
ncbi:ribosomal RNA methyltransferase-like protein, putative [Bodo saltans]|uniref:rRNA methyltransferase 2, mitochondrial n=1 Tax=Bodo saltans TaxID=75058 RepID=A0A0S4JUH0_BODSA|nr:ribosomal RNA methyltransferase-like protein, putative [Bodo saltans]|eukprot:CUG92213.1 ribosomal RNA methyltransferase-like protein, putative [Bodo saltans]